MTEHQCNYAGGFCTICLKKQPRIVNGKEQGLSDTSSMLKTSYRTPQARKKKINSEFQSVVDDTMTFLGEDFYKKGNFAKYAGIIKRVGLQKAREWIKEMKQRGISKPAYFWGIVRNFNKLK